LILDRANKFNRAAPGGCFFPCYFLFVRNYLIKILFVIEVWNNRITAKYERGDQLGN